MYATEEHHIGNFDAGAFFQLHDFDESGGWTPDEVRRFYGLNDESNANVSAEKREEVTRVIFRDFDRDHNGVVERSEWIEAIAAGTRLPDFGVSLTSVCEEAKCVHREHTGRRASACDAELKERGQFET